MAKTARRKVSRRRVADWAAAQNPLQHPPFRWWHLLILLLAAVMAYLTVKAPGLQADWANLPILDWQHGVQLRVSIIVLCVYAVVFVRAYHPLTLVGLMLTAFGLNLRLGEAQINQEPLTMGFLILLLALLVWPVRAMVRPNDADLIRKFKERHQQDAAEIAQLKKRLEQYCADEGDL